MKKLMLIIVLLFSTIALAETDLPQEVLTTIVESNREEPWVSRTEIKEGMKMLASSMQVTVESLWNILIRQQYVWSICKLFVTILAIYNIHSVKRLLTSKKVVEDKGDSFEITTANTGLLVVHLILGIFSGVASAVYFESMVTGFVNPEFGAIRTIISFTASVYGVPN